MNLLRYGGEAWRMELGGVRYLKADGFREGNIVSNCEVITGVDAPREWLEELVLGPHPSAAPEYHEKHRLCIDQLAELIRSGDLKLIVIAPSYGCDLLALCESVDAFQVD